MGMRLKGLHIARPFGVIELMDTREKLCGAFISACFLSKI